jgi:O-antigen ligase
LQDRKALHNLFFDISTGVGIPGLMCYLLFFFLPWLAHFKRWYTGEVGSNDYSKIINLATLCGIPAYWLASMFSSGVFLESSYLLVCVSCSGLLLMDLQDEEIEALEGIDQEDFFEETQLDEEFGPLVGSA